MARQRAEEILNEWPEDPTEVAREVTEKYGEPDEVTPSRLLWFDNGPWKRTVMHREATPHEFPKEHTDLLKQTIDYEVPPEHYDDLGRFDGSITVDRTKGELAATCHGEAANYLALNLAHEVITGERSVEEARRVYAETVAEKDAGGSPDYMQGFTFDVPRGDQGDPDGAMITDEMRREAEQQVRSVESE